MKIYPGLIASDFMMTTDNHSWRIWLWETQEDLQRWADRYAAGPMHPGKYDNAVGLHSPCELITDDEIPQHLGELHFVKDEWDLNKVAHEMLHGLFWYIVSFVPNFARALYLHWMDEEEELCYPFGEWVDYVYCWLRKKNPNPKWE